MNIEQVHPILALLLVMAPLFLVLVVVLDFVADMMHIVSTWRLRVWLESLYRNPVEASVEVANKWLARARTSLALQEAVYRYLTIPFLAALPFALVYWLAFVGGFSGIFNSLAYSLMAWGYWSRYKNRKNKRKIKEKLLAKVEQLGGKLVVVPVGAR